MVKFKFKFYLNSEWYKFQFKPGFHLESLAVEGSLNASNFFYYLLSTLYPTMRTQRSTRRTIFLQWKALTRLGCWDDFFSVQLYVTLCLWSNWKVQGTSIAEMQIEPKKLNMDQEVDLVESDSEDLPAVPPSQPRDELDSVVGESGATRDEPDREEVPVSTPPLVPSTVLGAELADPTMSAERLAGLKRQLTEVTAAEKTKAKEPGSRNHVRLLQRERQQAKPKPRPSRQTKSRRTRRRTRLSLKRLILPKSSQALMETRKRSKRPALRTFTINRFVRLYFMSWLKDLNRTNWFDWLTWYFFLCQVTFAKEPIIVEPTAASIEEEAKNKQSPEVPNLQPAEPAAAPEPLPEKPKRRRRPALRPAPTTAETSTEKAEEVTPKTTDPKPKRARRAKTTDPKSEDSKKEGNTKIKNADASEALLLRFRLHVTY